MCAEVLGLALGPWQEAAAPRETLGLGFSIPWLPSRSPRQHNSDWGEAGCVGPGCSGLEARSPTAGYVRASSPPGSSLCWEGEPLPYCVCGEGAVRAWGRAGSSWAVLGAGNGKHGGRSV